MTKNVLNISLFTLFCLTVSNPAFAETSMYPAYFFFGSGILLVFALAVYVVKQSILSIRNHCDKKPVE
ncbi:hypothetical protein [Acinetobacter faecalis]|uniref:hypothetical protein n=1 Tax=Acinetobacter faecalis TaxID=2665161 RepID=UPI002A913B15|nr:hypothetical protein [Acinetobacter faecalis]MDY6450001.1 hypothetical protein [Acinetobacter faecalis]